MTEPRDVLDLLLRDAPPVPPGFGDTVLRRARRRRRVHRATVAAGTTGLTVAVAAGVVLANDPAPAPPARPPYAGPATTPPPATTTAPAPPGYPAAVAREAAIQSAAIRYLAGQMDDGRRWPVLFVLDRRYRGIVGDPDGWREAAPLAAANRMALAEALSAYAPVEFVADVDDAFEPSTGMARRGGAVVMLGVPVTARDGRVSFELSVQRGGKAGRGEVLLLTPTAGGGWSVASTERGWIS